MIVFHYKNFAQGSRKNDFLKHRTKKVSHKILTRNDSRPNIIKMNNIMNIMNNIKHLSKRINFKKGVILKPILVGWEPLNICFYSGFGKSNLVIRIIQKTASNL